MKSARGPSTTCSSVRQVGTCRVPASPASPAACDARHGAALRRSAQRKQAREDKREVDVVERALPSKPFNPAAPPLMMCCARAVCTEGEAAQQTALSLS